MLKRTLLLLAACAMSPLAAQSARPALGEAQLRTALTTPGRPAAAVQLDEVRRPAEVLRFMGLRRGDRVLDYFTGNGYYAEIMARAVGPEGLVVGWNGASFMRRESVRAALAELRARQPNTAFYGTPQNAIALPSESFDFVMLHLVYHDAYWESAEFGVPRHDPNDVVRALWNATKPGGIVAVVDHAAAPGGDTRAVVEAVHRIDPAVVRADFERAGFVLEAQSDLLQNPSDNYATNVFDPAIRGRTDRFAYRFRKPRR